MESTAQHSEIMKSTDLPEAIIENILLKLDNPKDLVRFSVVSKHWNTKVRSPLFWRRENPVLCIVSPWPSPRESFLHTAFGFGVFHYHQYHQVRTLADGKICAFSYSNGLLCTVMLPGLDLYEIRLMSTFHSGNPMDVIYLPFPVGAKQTAASTSVLFFSDSLTHLYTIVLCIQYNDYQNYGYFNELFMYKSSSKTWKLRAILGIQQFKCHYLLTSAFLLAFDSSKRDMYKYMDENHEKKRVVAPWDGVITGFTILHGRIAIIAEGKQAGGYCYEVWVSEEEEQQYVFTRMSFYEISGYGINFNRFFTKLFNRDQENDPCVLLARGWSSSAAYVIYFPTTGTWKFYHSSQHGPEGFRFVPNPRWLFTNPTCGYLNQPG